MKRFDFHVPNMVKELARTLGKKVLLVAARCADCSLVELTRGDFVQLHKESL